MPRSTQSLRRCSNGSSMPSPTDRPPASWQPRLTASIVPGPPPVITAKSVAGQRGAELPAERVLGVVARGAGRAEDRDRPRQLGEHAEALDELRLDAQHPPRVGVHPVAGAAGVQQPLVGGARLDALLAARSTTGPRCFSAPRVASSPVGVVHRRPVVRWCSRRRRAGVRR